MTPFRNVRISKDKLGKLLHAASVLSKSRGRAYRLTRLAFGRYIVAENPRIIVASVSTNSRPPSSTVVAVVPSGRLLLPSECVEDARECSILLEAHSEEDQLFLERAYNPSREGRR